MLGAGARATVLALALAVGLGTGACAGDGEPATLPSLTPSESDSGTASGRPSSTPSKPASRKAEVVDAVRAFYEAANHAADTGETGGLIGTSTDECDCRQLVEHLQEAFADGRLEGFDLKIESISVISVSGAIAKAKVRYVRSAYEQFDADGSVENRFEAAHVVTLVSTLRGRDGRWRVSGVDTVRQVAA